VLLLALLSWLALLPLTLTFVGHGLSLEQRATVTSAVRWLGPYFLLNGLNLVGYGGLQARKAFSASAAIPLVTPVATIVFVILQSPSLQVLVGAITAGTGVETLLIALLCVRRPIGAAWRAAERAPWLRELARGTAHLLPGTVLTGLTPMIEQAIASTLGRGAISSLGYASKLPATINTLLVTAVGVTILPYFSELVASGKLAQCRTFFLRYAIILLGVGVAVLVVTSLVSEPFVRIAFQRGAFAPRDTVIVATLQQAYLWQVPGALVSILAVRFVAAFGRFKALAANQLVIVPLVGLLQWRLAASWGAAGVAFGTAIGATLSAVAATWLALRISR
jgi:peptidoglycan biosynthesis protein MviN/MurJ (putative lipid II flippase)